MKFSIIGFFLFIFMLWENNFSMNMLFSHWFIPAIPLVMMLIGAMVEYKKKKFRDSAIPPTSNN